MARDAQHGSDPPAEIVVAGRFDSFEAFAEAARQWDLDFRQLDSGPLEAELVNIVTPAVILGRCRLNRRFEQRGMPPVGYRTFGLGADNRLAIRWRGKHVGPDHLMLFPPGEPLDSVTEPGFDVFPLSVSEECLQAAAGRRGLARTDELFPDSDLLACPPDALRPLRELATILTDAAAADPAIVRNRWFRISLEEDLVEGLLDGIAASTPPLESEALAPARSEALRKALALIEARARDPVPISEIERASEVSPRTLRYAFEQEFGIPPKKYMQTFRLNQVQRELLRAGPREESVAAVAEAWGFWHMGQFARDYRKLFCELPSETLRRSG